MNQVTDVGDWVEAPIMFHKRILEWQAEHPTITWIFWIIVWIFVFVLLFRPTRIGGMVL
jgi:hypothetical protein